MESILQTILDLFLLVAFGATLAGIFLSGQNRLRLLSAGASVIVLLLLLGALSAVIVPAGSVGVVTSFGKVQDETLTPGLHFRLPFANAVHTITTRVQPHEFKEINAASAEYQTVKLTGIMNYHLDGPFASDLFQRVGDDFAAKVLDPAFNDYIKTVVPNYRIGEILGKRDEIRARAKADLQANLSQYHIIVDDIYISNIGFSPEYEAAIESKQVAQQQVETERQITEQRKQQAQQAIESAKGNAQSLIENARGQAEANNLLTESLSPELIQYTMIQKLSNQIQVMVVPDNGNFLFNLQGITPK